MKFKVGDRVRAIGEVDGVDFTGRTGTVVRLSFGDFVIGVEFDKRTPSLCTQHSCNGAGKKGYCRWGCEREFELITPKNNKKIVITSDGVETLARLYDGNKVIKSATAKCSPDDEFDFETGAKIAFDRLVGKVNEPAYFAGYRKQSEGEWIYHECVSSYDGAKSGYSCSNCHAFVDEETFDTDEFHKAFCGACGSKNEKKYTGV